MNGDLRFDGVVEICYEGLWNTVCTDGWSFRDAVVTCRQMGFPGEGIIVNYYTFMILMVIVTDLLRTFTSM